MRLAAAIDLHHHITGIPGKLTRICQTAWVEHGDILPDIQIRLMGVAIHHDICLAALPLLSDPFHSHRNSVVVTVTEKNLLAGQFKIRFPLQRAEIIIVSRHHVQRAAGQFCDIIFLSFHVAAVDQGIHRRDPFQNRFQISGMSMGIAYN